MQAVIICGGKGSRLKSVIGNKAKALVKFKGKENLKNQISILKPDISLRAISPSESCHSGDAVCLSFIGDD